MAPLSHSKRIAATVVTLALGSSSLAVAQAQTSTAAAAATTTSAAPTTTNKDANSLLIGGQKGRPTSPHGGAGIATTTPKSTAPVVDAYSWRSWYEEPILVSSKPMTYSLLPTLKGDQPQGGKLSEANGIQFELDSAKGVTVGTVADWTKAWRDYGSSSNNIGSPVATSALDKFITVDRYSGEIKVDLTSATAEERAALVSGRYTIPVRITYPEGYPGVTESVQYRSLPLNVATSGEFMSNVSLDQVRTETSDSSNDGGVGFRLGRTNKVKLGWANPYVPAAVVAAVFDIDPSTYFDEDAATYDKSLPTYDPTRTRGYRGVPVQKIEVDTSRKIALRPRDGSSEYWVDPFSNPDEELKLGQDQFLDITMDDALVASITASPTLPKKSDPNPRYYDWRGYDGLIFIPFKVTMSDGTIAYTSLMTHPVDSHATYLQPSYADLNLDMRGTKAAEAPVAQLGSGLELTAEGAYMTTPRYIQYDNGSWQLPDYKFPEPSTIKYSVNAEKSVVPATVDKDAFFKSGAVSVAEQGGQLSFKAPANGEYKIAVDVQYPAANSLDWAFTSWDEDSSHETVFAKVMVAGLADDAEPTVNPDGSIAIPDNASGATVDGATDANGNKVADGAIVVDPKTGVISVDTTKDPLAPGEYTVTVRVTYPDGSVDTVTTKIKVDENTYAKPSEPAPAAPAKDDSSKCVAQQSSKVSPWAWLIPLGILGVAAIPAETAESVQRATAPINEALGLNKINDAFARFAINPEDGQRILAAVGALAGILSAIAVFSKVKDNSSC